MNDQQFLEMVVRQFPLTTHCIHGVSHWIKVRENGFRIADRNGANKNIIRYFAFLHDCRRMNNNGDYNHGPRAADFARKHRSKINLSDDEFKLLVEALADHTRGCSKDSDITVKTCLDADRLDLGRVGCVPNPTWLYTDAGKEEAVSIQKRDFGWRDRKPISRRRI